MIKENKLKILGNCSIGKSQAGFIYDSRFISQTICACTHGYAFGYIFARNKGGTASLRPLV